MSSIRNIVATLKGDKAAEASSTERRKVGRASTCEALEDRQLLNGSWGGAMAAGAMGGGPFSVSNTNGGTAQFQSFGGQNDFGYSRFAGPMNFRAMPGQPATTTTSSSSSDPSTSSSTSSTTTTSSSTTNNGAAWQTLQTDIQTLNGMVSTSLQDSIKSDVAIIDRALATLAQTKSASTTGSSSSTTTDSSSSTTTDSSSSTTTDGSTTTASSSSTTTTDALTKLTTLLQDAKVSDNVISGIKTDIQNYQSAIASADTTLYDKINSERATLIAGLPTDQQTVVTKYGTGLDGLGGNFGINLDADTASSSTVTPSSSTGTNVNGTWQGAPGFAANSQGFAQNATTIQATPFLASNQGGPSFAMNSQGGYGNATNSQGGPSFVMDTQDGTTTQATPVTTSQGVSTLTQSNQGGPAFMMNSQGRAGFNSNSNASNANGQEGPGGSGVATNGGGQYARQWLNNTGGSGGFGSFFGGRGFGGFGR